LEYILPVYSHYTPTVIGNGDNYQVPTFPTILPDLKSSFFFSCSFANNAFFSLIFKVEKALTLLIEDNN
jgi:hypothetical protein